jgi:parallel beta-helix repeat protein
MLLLTVTYLAICTAQGLSSGLNYKPDELLVRFAPQPDGKQMALNDRNQLLVSANAGTVKRSYKIVPGLTLVKLPPNLKVTDAIVNLKGKDKIVYVEPNYKIKVLSTVPNDPCFTQLWAMHNTGLTGGTEDADIDAPEAWDIITDSNIIVAVLDTGIDYTHPDLTANIWVNETELNGTSDYDDDGNGYIDDVYGWDFADNDEYPMDYLPHGTHVAGIIGAVGNNSVGVTGVCWNVKIMNLKIFPNYGNEGFISGAIDAIEYAVDKGARILNNSWGGEIDPDLIIALKDAIEAADANGVIFVAAAGNNPPLPWYDNDITPVYPANYDCDNIISVMATNPDDGIAYYSHYGATSVDLAAPGGEIYYVGDPGGILSTIPGNSYDFYHGTSMAAPHVAGACALVWAANPTWTHLQVKNRIMGSVDYLESLEGLCVTRGRLNLYNALAWPFPAVGPVIFVDKDAAAGLNNGSSWDNAFLDLQDAIITARRYAGQAIEIWVAAGTYKPVNSLVQDYQNKSFKLPSDVALFGHFGGIGTYEKRVNQRNLADANNETILNGQISQGDHVLNVVTARGVTGAVLDGFTVTGAFGYYYYSECGIKLDNGADVSIVNCKIKNNYYGIIIKNGSQADIHNCTVFSDNDSASTGIEAIDSALNISNSVFTGHSYCSIDASSTNLTVTDSNFIEAFYCSFAILLNSGQAEISGCLIQNEAFSGVGISCNDGGNMAVTDCNIQKCYVGLESSQSDVNVIDCNIHANKYIGIQPSNSNVNIIRSYIYENDYDSDYSDSAGIYLMFTGNFKILNSWIYRNNCGIYLFYVDYATEIRNSTIAYNTGIGIYSSGTAPQIKNCIIWNPNPNADDLDGCSATYSCIYDNDIGDGVIHSDPCFYPYADDDYHLTVDSPCIDKGDGTYDETDIDGEDRVVDGDGNGEPNIDMGADEYYHPKADYNRDEIVNFIDYSYFANNWLDVNEDISLDNDSYVDVCDLALFCKDWLWTAPWGSGFSLLCMGGGEMSLSESVSPQLYVGGYYPGGLMLSDISESLDAMPDSLYSKVEKFYMSPTVSPQASLGVLSPQQSAALIEELLEWLDELWEQGDIKESMTYEQYIEFRDSIKESTPLY